MRFSSGSPPLHPTLFPGFQRGGRKRSEAARLSASARRIDASDNHRVEPPSAHALDPRPSLHFLVVNVLPMIRSWRLAMRLCVWSLAAVLIVFFACASTGLAQTSDPKRPLPTPPGDTSPAAPAPAPKSASPAPAQAAPPAITVEAFRQAN